MKFFIGLALLLTAPSFAVDGCRNTLLRSPDTTVPARAITLAFARAKKLEKEGRVPEASAALLYLAKSMASDAKLKWPTTVGDAEIEDALWATHVALLSGNESLVPALKIRLGEPLMRLLRDQGAIGVNPLANPFADTDTDLLFVTEWFERRRTDARELEALIEWREGVVGRLLKEAGTFTRISLDGTPVFRPTSLAALLSLPADSQQKILALDLADFNMGPAEIEKLVAGNFVNVMELDVRRNRLGSQGLKNLCVQNSPFKNVRYLDLVLNQIGDEGVEALIAPGTPFKNLRNLDLQCNAIGKPTIKKVSSPASGLTRLISVIGASQRVVEEAR